MSEYYRRGSPESSRRRRRERHERDHEHGHGPEHSYQHSHDAAPPATAPQYIPTGSRPQTHERDNADSSSTLSSSSTSESLLNISAPKSRAAGILSFFTSPDPAARRRKYRKKKKRLLGFGNSSSSSLEEALAYGRGYVDKERREAAQAAAEGRPHAYPTQYSQNQQQFSQSRQQQYGSPRDHQRPTAPHRDKTDEEIQEIGRQLAKMARDGNREDVARNSSRRGISGLMAGAAAATAVAGYRRSKSSDKRSRGIGSSRPQQHSDSGDESDWETSSEDEYSSEDVDPGLAYGASTVDFPMSRPPPPAQRPAESRPMPAEARKSHVVDPQMFGPMNSLRGLINTPCGFDDPVQKQNRESEPRQDRPVPSVESASFEARPLREVYPVPTSDPDRFDITRAQSSSGPRPEPVPIQAPKPIVPISSRVYDAQDYARSEARSEPRSERELRKRNSDSSFANVALAGLAGVVGVGAAAKLASDYREKKRDDRRERDEPREKDVRPKRTRSEKTTRADEVPDHKDKRDDRRVRGEYRDVDARPKETRSEKITKADEEPRAQEGAYHRDGGHRSMDEPAAPTDDSRRRQAELEEKIRRLEASLREQSNSQNAQPESPVRDRDQDRERKRREKKRRSVVIEQGDEANASSKSRDKGRYDGDEPKTSKRSSRSFGSAVASSSKSPTEPRDSRAADDDFPVPMSQTPNRPLTPMITTVEREPDFSRFDARGHDQPRGPTAELPRDRLSRLDSFEREVQDVNEFDSKDAREAAEHSTDPLPEAAIAAAAAVLARHGHRGKGMRTSEPQPKRSRSEERDAVQEEADRHYRQSVLARKIAEDQIRSRSASPDNSPVDGHHEDPVIRIVTPPEMHRHEKNKFEAPNADVRIDNIIEPKDLEQYRLPRGAHLGDPSIFPVFKSRDPSAERERPMLNLVRPTPAVSPIPSPSPEEQQPRASPKAPEKVATQEPKSASDVIMGPRGETIDVEPREKSVLPKEEKSIDKIPEVSEGKKKKKKKGSAWGSVLAGIAGAGAATAIAAAADDASKTTHTPEEDDKKEPAMPGAFDSGEVPAERDETTSRKSRKGKGKQQVWDDEPPSPGPKPASPSTSQTQGAFADDLDFAATLAAGLQDSGFDPNIVIDDPLYRRRDSPPGSSEPLEDSYRTSFSEVVPDLDANFTNPVVPRSSSGPSTVIEIPRSDPIPDATETFKDAHEEAIPRKLSKKERRKLKEAQNKNPDENLVLDREATLVDSEEKPLPPTLAEGESTLVENTDTPAQADFNATEEPQAPSGKKKKKTKKAAQAVSPWDIVEEPSRDPVEVSPTVVADIPKDTVDEVRFGWRDQTDYKADATTPSYGSEIPTIIAQEPLPLQESVPRNFFEDSVPTSNYATPAQEAELPISSYASTPAVEDTWDALPSKTKKKKGKKGTDIEAVADPIFEPTQDASNELSRDIDQAANITMEETPAPQDQTVEPPLEDPLPVVEDETAVSTGKKKKKKSKKAAAVDAVDAGAELSIDLAEETPKETVPEASPAEINQVAPRQPTLEAPMEDLEKALDNPSKEATSETPMEDLEKVSETAPETQPKDDVETLNADITAVDDTAQNAVLDAPKDLFNERSLDSTEATAAFSANGITREHDALPDGSPAVVIDQDTQTGPSSKKKKKKGKKNAAPAEEILPSTPVETAIPTEEVSLAPVDDITNTPSDVKDITSSDPKETASGEPGEIISSEPKETTSGEPKDAVSSDTKEPDPVAISETITEALPDEWAMPVITSKKKGKKSKGSASVLEAEPSQMPDSGAVAAEEAAQVLKEVTEPVDEVSATDGAVSSTTPELKQVESFEDSKPIDTLATGSDGPVEEIKDTSVPESGNPEAVNDDLAAGSSKKKNKKKKKNKSSPGEDEMTNAEPSQLDMAVQETSTPSEQDALAVGAEPDKPEDNLQPQDSAVKTEVETPTVESGLNSVSAETSKKKGKKGKKSVQDKTTATTEPSTPNTAEHDKSQPEAFEDNWATPASTNESKKGKGDDPWAWEEETPGLESAPAFEIEPKDQQEAGFEADWTAPSTTKKGKKNKKATAGDDDALGVTASEDKSLAPLDSVDSTREGDDKTVVEHDSQAVEADLGPSKKSKKKSKKTASTLDSPKEVTAPSESSPSGTGTENPSAPAVDDPADTDDNLEFFEANQEEDVPDNIEQKNNGGWVDDAEDVKTVVSAPTNSAEKAADKEEKRSGGGFFSFWNRSSNTSDNKETQNEGKDKRHSFLANAGTIGAGVGLAGAAAAIASHASHSNATSKTKKDSSPSRSTSSPSQDQGSFDPEIIERVIKPAIDPQFGDLLPLPPSVPASPTTELPSEEDLPALPISRPETPPEQERKMLREKWASRRRSQLETPVKSPSTTAVPIQFRLRSGPSSPGLFIKTPPTQPQPPISLEPSSASRRVLRPMSWDTTREIKPLYLPEHVRSGSATENDLQLPELPESRPSTSGDAAGPEDRSWAGNAYSGYNPLGATLDSPLQLNTGAVPAYSPSDPLGSGDVTPKAEQGMKPSDGLVLSDTETSDVFEDAASQFNPSSVQSPVTETHGLGISADDGFDRQLENPLISPHSPTKDGLHGSSALFGAAGMGAITAALMSHADSPEIEELSSGIKALDLKDDKTLGKTTSSSELPSDITSEIIKDDAIGVTGDGLSQPEELSETPTKKGKKAKKSKGKKSAMPDATNLPIPEEKPSEESPPTESSQSLDQTEKRSPDMLSAVADSADTSQLASTSSQEQTTEPIIAPETEPVFPDNKDKENQDIDTTTLLNPDVPEQKQEALSRDAEKSQIHDNVLKAEPITTEQPETTAKGKKKKKKGKKGAAAEPEEVPRPKDTDLLEKQETHEDKVEPQTSSLPTLGDGEGSKDAGSQHPSAVDIEAPPDSSNIIKTGAVPLAVAASVATALMQDGPGSTGVSQSADENDKMRDLGPLQGGISGETGLTDTTAEPDTAGQQTVGLSGESGDVASGSDAQSKSVGATPDNNIDTATSPAQDPLAVPAPIPVSAEAADSHLHDGETPALADLGSQARRDAEDGVGLMDAVAKDAMLVPSSQPVETSSEPATQPEESMGQEQETRSGKKKGKKGSKKKQTTREPSPTRGDPVAEPVAESAIALAAGDADNDKSHAIDITSEQSTDLASTEVVDAGAGEVAANQGQAAEEISMPGPSGSKSKKDKKKNKSANWDLPGEDAPTDQLIENTSATIPHVDVHEVDVTIPSEISSGPQEETASPLASAEKKSKKDKKKKKGLSLDDQLLAAEPPAPSQDAQIPAETTEPPTTLQETDAGPKEEDLSSAPALSSSTKKDKKGKKKKASAQPDLNESPDSGISEVPSQSEKQKEGSQDGPATATEPSQDAELPPAHSISDAAADQGTIALELDKDEKSEGTQPTEVPATLAEQTDVSPPVGDKQLSGSHNAQDGVASEEVQNTAEAEVPPADTSHQPASDEGQSSKPTEHETPVANDDSSPSDAPAGVPEKSGLEQYQDGQLVTSSQEQSENVVGTQDEWAAPAKKGKKGKKGKKQTVEAAAEDDTSVPVSMVQDSTPAVTEPEAVTLDANDNTDAQVSVTKESKKSKKKGVLVYDELSEDKKSDETVTDVPADVPAESRDGEKPPVTTESSADALLTTIPSALVDTESAKAPQDPSSNIETPSTEPNDKSLIEGDNKAHEPDSVEVSVENSKDLPVQEEIQVPENTADVVVAEEQLPTTTKKSKKDKKKKKGKESDEQALADASDAPVISSVEKDGSGDAGPAKTETPLDHPEPSDSTPVDAPTFVETPKEEPTDAPMKKSKKDKKKKKPAAADDDKGVATSQAEPSENLPAPEAEPSTTIDTSTKDADMPTEAALDSTTASDQFLEPTDSHPDVKGDAETSATQDVPERTDKDPVASENPGSVSAISKDGDSTTAISKERDLSSSATAPVDDSQEKAVSKKSKKSKKQKKQAEALELDSEPLQTQAPEPHPSLPEDHQSTEEKPVDVPTTTEPEIADSAAASKAQEATPEDFAPVKKGKKGKKNKAAACEEPVQEPSNETVDASDTSVKQETGFSAIAEPDPVSETTPESQVNTVAEDAISTNETPLPAKDESSSAVLPNETPTEESTIQPPVGDSSESPMPDSQDTTPPDTKASEEPELVVGKKSKKDKKKKKQAAQEQKEELEKDVATSKPVAELGLAQEADPSQVAEAVPVETLEEPSLPQEVGSPQVVEPAPLETPAEPSLPQEADSSRVLEAAPVELAAETSEKEPKKKSKKDKKKKGSVAVSEGTPKDQPVLPSLSDADQSIHQVANIEDVAETTPEYVATPEPAADKESEPTKKSKKEKRKSKRDGLAQSVSLDVSESKDLDQVTATNEPEESSQNDTSHQDVTDSVLTSETSQQHQEGQTEQQSTIEPAISDDPVDKTLDKEPAIAGDTVEASGTSNDLQGALAAAGVGAALGSAATTLMSSDLPPEESQVSKKKSKKDKKRKDAKLADLEAEPTLPAPPADDAVTAPEVISDKPDEPPSELTTESQPTDTLNPDDVGEATATSIVEGEEKPTEPEAIAEVPQATQPAVAQEEEFPEAAAKKSKKDKKKKKNVKASVSETIAEPSPVAETELSINPSSDDVGLSVRQNSDEKANPERKAEAEADKDKEAKTESKADDLDANVAPDNDKPDLATQDNTTSTPKENAEAMGSEDAKETAQPEAEVDDWGFSSKKSKKDKKKKGGKAAEPQLEPSTVTDFIAAEPDVNPVLVEENPVASPVPELESNTEQQKDIEADETDAWGLTSKKSKKDKKKKKGNTVLDLEPPVTSVASATPSSEDAQPASITDGIDLAAAEVAPVESQGDAQPAEPLDLKTDLGGSTEEQKKPVTEPEPEPAPTADVTSTAAAIDTGLIDLASAPETTEQASAEPPVTEPSADTQTQEVDEVALPAKKSKKDKKKKKKGQDQPTVEAVSESTAPAADPVGESMDSTPPLKSPEPSAVQPETKSKEEQIETDKPVDASLPGKDEGNPLPESSGPSVDLHLKEDPPQQVVSSEPVSEPTVSGKQDAKDTESAGADEVTEVVTKKSKKSKKKKGANVTDLDSASGPLNATQDANVVEQPEGSDSKTPVDNPSIIAPSTNEETIEVAPSTPTAAQSPKQSKKSKKAAFIPLTNMEEPVQEVNEASAAKTTTEGGHNKNLEEASKSMEMVPTSQAEAIKDSYFDTKPVDEIEQSLPGSSGDFEIHPAVASLLDSKSNEAEQPIPTSAPPGLFLMTREGSDVFLKDGHVPRLLTQSTDSPLTSPQALDSSEDKHTRSISSMGIEGADPKSQQEGALREPISKSLSLADEEIICPTPNVKESPAAKPVTKDDVVKASVASAVVGGGAAALASKVGASSKKSKKKKKTLDKRTQQSDDLFDDPSLWEGTDRKLVEGSRGDLDSGDFWEVPDTKTDEIGAAEESGIGLGINDQKVAWGMDDGGNEDTVHLDKPNDAATDAHDVWGTDVVGAQENSRRLKHSPGRDALNIDTGSDPRTSEQSIVSTDENGRRGGIALGKELVDSPMMEESPILGRGTNWKQSQEKEDSSADPTPKATPAALEGQVFSPPASSTDAPVVGQSHQAENKDEKLGSNLQASSAEGAETSMPSPRSPLGWDSGKDAAGSPYLYQGSDAGVSPSRTLPPVKEEEDEGEVLTAGRRASLDKVNRDSGYSAGEPPLEVVRRRPRLGRPEVSPQRDSGVHLRDWPESEEPRISPSPTPRRGRAELNNDDTLKTPNKEFSSDKGTKVESSPPAEGHTSRALFNPSTPKLGEPEPQAQTPDPSKKKALSGSSKKRGTYQELGSAAIPPAILPASATPTTISSPAEAASSSSSSSLRRQGYSPAVERSLSYSHDQGVSRHASNMSATRLRATPEPLNFRPDSPGNSSIRSFTGTPPLRRADRRVSGDLRSLSQRSSVIGQTQDKQKDKDQRTSGAAAAVVGGVGAAAASIASRNNHHDGAAQSSTQDTTPVANEGRVRAKDMTDVYDGYGEGRIGSPRSPTRPHSMRRRQSMQVLELESRVDQLLAENRALNEARTKAEQSLSQKTSSLLADRDDQIDALKRSVEFLNQELSRLTEVNEGLHSAISQTAVQHDDRYRQLQSQHDSTKRELEQTRSVSGASAGATQALLADKDAEISRLRAELESTKQRVRELQRQKLADRPANGDFLTVRDIDYFDHRCQALCSHVQQWVLRFSKFSDMRACRLTNEINDEKIIDRLDNALLDGSDVDHYLRDRVKRRDVFMSMTMSMIWEFVFTRYLFGMDREQRQKLKSLEKLLLEVGPPQAVRQWRAITLTLLSRRPSFRDQKEQDTEAVVQAVLQTLSMILPPPSNLEDQIQSQLRRVVREAVDLSVEMRTQRAEYVMLPPLQPEYDANGDLAATVTFNAAMMNERSSPNNPPNFNEELQAEGATVRIVLFPLVVKKGDDNGVGDDEIVVHPAQVLVPKSSSSGRRGRMATPSSDAGGVSLLMSRGGDTASRSNISMQDVGNNQSTI
ncbi:uncharacterized protein PgNI_03868 [Pyricularia grisea]|uniref:Involucrin repeat protein n=1 Tax=Pyricularia grisea TaxID=148305 RepID=A0A6P8BEP0_PYRGI|nr:uncharacterized protein PgNI_03868 [Pyricularia grisea]TLD14162.1 hypothetical protein PgNI_03868 [Pyricularia grisea]